MSQLSFLLEGVYVSRTKKRGRGVFCKVPIEAGTLIEMAPVIVLNSEERKLIDQTLLHDYIFEWGDLRQQCCVGLGIISIYNHAYDSNCEYEMHYKKEVITIKAVRHIPKGEELFINYNGDWNDNKKVWFETK